MQRFVFVIYLLVILFIAHHLMIYLHEWTHGFVAWVAGYKSSPFAIHYGEKWFTLWDIDEAVNYPQIYSDGKAYLVAWIAIAPTLLQMILFPIGLKVLSLPKIRNTWWLFAFVYFFTLFLLAETYAYIPIRTFSGVDDIHNYLTATGLSPWTVAIPGTLYVIWGMYQILNKQIPRAYSSLKISTKSGRFVFTLTTLVIFFGYYGAIGFTKSDVISHFLSLASWAILLVGIVILCVQTMTKNVGQSRRR